MEKIEHKSGYLLWMEGSEEDCGCKKCIKFRKEWDENHP